MEEKCSSVPADLMARIYALCEDEDDLIAIMATVSAELFQAVEGYDWVGFYRVVAPNLLKIGPYQGGHGCLVIPFDQGVCGAAARYKTIQLVDDVDGFEGISPVRVVQNLNW
jgi:GAF domain-containing protein